MTENEVIEVLKNEKKCVLRNINGCDRDCGKCDLVMEDSIIINAYDSSIVALSEIQQYRAIGKIDELKNREDCFNAREKYIKQILWERDIALGQLEEIGISLGEKMDFTKEIIEKQRPKKPIMKPFYEDMEEEYLCCPNCGDILTDRIPMDNKYFYFHCFNCGQKLDWSDTD